MISFRLLSLFVFFFLISIFGCAAEESSHNEQLARSFMEAWSSHDIDGLTALFAEDCLYEEVASGRSYTNKKGIADYASSTISGVPDSKFEIIETAANDSIAMVEWVWKGTNSVGWPDMGLPATNRYFELRGTSIMKIENGLIIRNSDYWDWNTFLKGIGVE